jgi:serine phosphatase RsbU (regulator of sigma subunit)
MNERILIVDDAPAVLQSVAEILKGRGYQLSAAAGGAQALELLGRLRPDLILLDVMMPGMDGVETCRRIKETPGGREIPVIFLTGKAETADVVRGFEAGAVDYVAKPFNPPELLARISTHLTIDRLRRSLEEKNQALAEAHRREMEMAARVQAQLIPASLPPLAGWDFAAHWQPAKEVSGDYYDFLPGPGRLGVVVADVSGKGMHAALVMASTRSLVRANAAAQLGPADSLHQVNASLCADATQGMFVTLFYAELEAGSGAVEYVSCGHTPPLRWRAADGAVEEFDSTGTVLGMDETARFAARRVELGAGDVLLLLTDGYAEAFDARSRPFGDERLRELLAAHAKEPAARILERVKGAVERFVGDAPVSDDRTIVVARRL